MHILLCLLDLCRRIQLLPGPSGTQYHALAILYKFIPSYLMCCVLSFSVRLFKKPFKCTQVSVRTCELFASKSISNVLFLSMIPPYSGVTGSSPGLANTGMLWKGGSCHCACSARSLLPLSEERTMTAQSKLYCLHKVGIRALQKSFNISIVNK